MIVISIAIVIVIVIIIIVMIFKTIYTLISLTMTCWLNLDQCSPAVHQRTLTNKLCFRCFEVFSPDQVCKTLFHFGAKLQLFPRFLVAEILAGLQTFCLWEYFQRFLVTKILPSFQTFQSFFLWQKSSVVFKLFQRFLVLEIVAGLPSRLSWGGGRLGGFHHPGNQVETPSLEKLSIW